MNANVRKWAFGLVAAASIVVTLAGCSPKKGASDAPATSSQEAPRPAMPGGGAGHTLPTGTVTPAGTIPEIWTQIAGEQTAMTADIQAGQLKNVHAHAFEIRDLLVALADKANVAVPADSTRLDGLVELVKTSAARLDELAAAGDLAGAKTEFAKLEALLLTVKSVPAAN